uniref:Uncharacterized protein n=1 Tax=Rhizophora mucronata TaxID=61149 RepID=A0A2P2P2I1_RHIMU
MHLGAKRSFFIERKSNNNRNPLFSINLSKQLPPRGELKKAPHLE